MKQRYIIGAVVAAMFLGVSIYALQGSKIEYSNLASAKESGRKVQIKGTWVKEKGAEYDANNDIFSFVMEDDSKTQISVVYHGARPNNFDIAESIVVKGRMENGVFESSEILTKCPSKYEGSADQLHQK